MNDTSQANQRVSMLVSQGDRLNKTAAKGTGNLNESHLLVHSVMARAFAVGVSCQPDLDLDLSRSLAQWREDRDLAA